MVQESEHGRLSTHTYTVTSIQYTHLHTLTHTEYIHMVYCVSKEYADISIETNTLAQMFRGALYKDVSWQTEEVR